MKFIINGKPHGKDRPRFRRCGNFVSTYNTKSTQEYEKSIKLSILEQCKDELDNLYEGPIKVSINAYFMPNKSISKKKHNELIGQSYLKKPDSDNIAKIICDGLNGVAFKDDSQISELKVNKYYSEEEKVEVEIIYER